MLRSVDWRDLIGADISTDMQAGKVKSVGAIMDAAVRGELSRAQALRLCKNNPEVVTLALLAAGKRIAEQNAELAKLEGKGGTAKPSPSTPSGMVPIYTKPNTPKRHKKPSALSQLRNRVILSLCS